MSMLYLVGHRLFCLKFVYMWQVSWPESIVWWLREYLSSCMSRPAPTTKCWDLTWLTLSIFSGRNFGTGKYVWGLCRLPGLVFYSWCIMGEVLHIAWDIFTTICKGTWICSLQKSHQRDWDLGWESRLGAMSNGPKMVKGLILVKTL